MTPARSFRDECLRPDCNGTPGRDCPECEGNGRYIMRTCPLCGDPASDYNNGTNDYDAMTCRNSCGYTWTRNHPEWLAQILPI